MCANVCEVQQFVCVFKFLSHIHSIQRPWYTKIFKRANWQRESVFQDIRTFEYSNISLLVSICELKCQNSLWKIWKYYENNKRKKVRKKRRTSVYTVLPMFCPCEHKSMEIYCVELHECTKYLAIGRNVYFVFNQTQIGIVWDYLFI